MNKNIKIFYQISFALGVILLILGILLIPSFIFLLQEQGIHFAYIINYAASNSILHDLIYFGGPIREILIGLIIVATTISILRKKTKTNRILDIGIVALPIVAVASFIPTIFITLHGIIFYSQLNEQIGAIVPFDNYVKIITYPIYMISIILIVVGYSKEKLSIFPRKYLQIWLLSLSLVIVILYDLLKFLRV